MQEDECGADYHRQPQDHWIVQEISNPMSGYPKYKKNRTTYVFFPHLYTPIFMSCTSSPLYFHPKNKTLHSLFSSIHRWGINALGSVIVELELEDGTIGVGTSIGGDPACYIIEKHLNRFVEGQDVRNIELMWDQMWRGTYYFLSCSFQVLSLNSINELWSKGTCDPCNQRC